MFGEIGNTRFIQREFKLRVNLVLHCSGAAKEEAIIDWSPTSEERAEN